MLWYSCRSTLVCRPRLRPRSRVVVPAFDGWRDVPRYLPGPSPVHPPLAMRSLGVPAAARFASVVPGARPGSLAENGL